MDDILAIAGCILCNSVIWPFLYPGGLANIRKTGGGWLFIHADLIALFICMAVLIVGMSLGPTFWNKVKERAKEALFIAYVAMQIAVYQVVITVVGDNFWLRLFVTAIAISTMGVIFVSMFYLWCFHEK